MPPFDIEQIATEIASLERKLTALRALQAAYELPVAGNKESPRQPPAQSFVAPQEQAAVHVPPPAARSPAAFALKPSVRRTEYAERVLRGVWDILLKSPGRPLATAVIYDELAKVGIPVRGEKPQNALSALISNAGLFQPHGRSGWTIKPEPPAQNAEAADAEILRGDASTASFGRLTNDHPSGQRALEELRPGGGT